MMSERISYRDRYFIPLNDKGTAMLDKILADNPVASTSEDADDGTQYQAREYSNTKKYSYEWFTTKPDMNVTEISGQVPNNRADIVYQAKQNAAKIGGVTHEDGSVSVYINDINRSVVLGTNGLKHSLDRRNNINGAVVLKAGEILQNSIRINELTPAKAEADESYVLIGASKSESGDLYIVRSVVNRYSNELTSIDVLYAINAKKENRPSSMLPGFQGPVTDSTISIAKLLDYVNKYFPDILPEDVLRHYGHTERPEGVLGEDTQYQERTSPLTDREVLSIAASDVDVKGLDEGEQDALRIFQQRLTNLYELE